MLWHGHEMRFGFIVAAMAGFLLTAVPSWTGEREFSGRPLVVARPTTFAYALLAGATLVRVFGPAFMALPYAKIIMLAAALWTASFALFLWVYTPILVPPRADGKPG